MSKHDWYLNKNRAHWSDTESPYANTADPFRLDEGFHNGPECRRCGRIACEHCTPALWHEECPVG